MTQMLPYKVFDMSHAKCDSCELKPFCHERKQRAYAAGPSKPFNGIMIVGEGPGQQEVNAGRPFVGRSGQLLRALCSGAGIDMDACWITNATLAKPPSSQSNDGPLHQRFPGAIHGCLSRLEAEIAYVKPRVILAFGNAALIALTGYETEFKKRVTNECEACNNERKIGPIYQCAKCRFVIEPVPHVWDDSGLFDGAEAVEGEESFNCVECGKTRGNDAGEHCQPPQNCPQCDARTSKLKLKMIKCQTCMGRKTKEETGVRFDFDYKITEVAGMIIPAERFNWHELGVKHIIATFHPSFLMRPAKSEGSGDKKVMAGQFAAYAVQRHLEKAAALAKADRAWTFEYDVTVGDGEDAAKLLDDLYLDALNSDEYELAADIETEAWGTAFYCQECNKKTAETTEPCPTDAQYVEDRPCAHCRTGEDDPETGQPLAKITVHELRPCELDARELEEVSKIKCIGFASRVLRRVVVCDTREMKKDSPLWLSIKDVLQSKSANFTHKKHLGIVFHHGTYDVPVIRKMWGIVCNNYSSDTLIKHHEAHADETHTLQHLAARYTYARLWKPPKQKRGAVIHEDFEELALYNARDCMVTAECSWALDIELRQEKMQELAKVDMALQKLALDMHWNGMPIDLNVAQKIGTEALGRKLENLREMRECLNQPEFNPNSAIQLRKALYETLGNTVTDWTDGGKSGKRNPSTAKESLVKLEDTPFKRSLLAYRDTDATLRSYFNVEHGRDGRLMAIPGRGLNLWDDGRFHARWKPFGTVTGRFSSNPNAQNFPRWLRAMIKVGAGRLIVGADYDQLELRVLAVLSGDTELISRCMNANSKRKLEPEYDPHSFVASYVFPKQYVFLSLNDSKHITDENVRCKCETCLRSNLRDLCKRVIYGLNYGAGEETVLASIYNGGYSGPPISVLDIRHIKKVIFEVFPGILPWREMMVETAQSTRELRSAFMHRRREFALGEIPVTEISNFPIQCLKGDTRVLTSTGFKKINTLGNTCFVSTGSGMEFARRLDKNAEQVWRTTLSNGQQLETNADHYLMTLDRGWCAVGDMNIGQLVAQPLVEPVEFDVTRPVDDELFYWLGYYIGNGSWTENNRSSIAFCFGTRIRRFDHEEYAKRFVCWLRKIGISHQKPQKRPNMTVVVMENDSARGLFGSWGLLQGHGAHEKRVPEPVWSARLSERKAFILGLLDADGTLSNDPPALHMCNRELLLEVQLLLRTVGASGRLYGPYKADKNGHTSWRLAMPGTLLSSALGYGSNVRLRYSNDTVLDPRNVEEFLSTFPRNPFGKTSYGTLWHRLCNKQSKLRVNPHTLKHMCQSLGFKPELPIYGYQEVTKVETLDEYAPMHTLMVQHDLHRYDSAGIISKNSTGADIVNERMLAFDPLRLEIDPTSILLVQGHDALYYEVEESKAPEFAAAMTKTLTCTKSYQGSDPMLFSAKAKIGDNLKALA